MTELSIIVLELWIIIALAVFGIVVKLAQLLSE